MLLLSQGATQPSGSKMLSARAHLGMRLSCQTLPGLQGLALGVLTPPGGGVSCLGLLIFECFKHLFICDCSGSSSLRLFSSCGERGYFMVVGSGLLIVVAPLVAEHQLSGTWAQ